MTAEARPAASLPDSFRLRAGTYSLLTLRLVSPRAEDVLPALGEQFRKAPGFLRFAPIAIGLDEVEGQQVDFAALVDGLRALEIIPVGVTGGGQALRADAAAAGLPLLRAAGGGGEVAPMGAAGGVAVAVAPVVPVAAPAPPRPAAAKTMLVTQAVRAGQRIYAQGADLVVMGAVNAGAEVLADGNIHVYGALRGRAVAGAQEDAEARIFATHFDPELVAIAGFYAVREGFQDTDIGRAVAVRLDGEQLRFDPLV
ncbi:septum site-determining protein MinC [Roseococcus sp. DSY-14]|uniref:septum site-determining protein MinC n=1 Tax=Roseococcus sp. DSY-14 TaxID=3369650 RepID=UPI00387B9182